jgi:hypothetical protein
MLYIWACTMLYRRGCTLLYIRGCTLSPPLRTRDACNLPKGLRLVRPVTGRLQAPLQGGYRHRYREVTGTVTGRLQAPSQGGYRHRYREVTGTVTGRLQAPLQGGYRHCHKEVTGTVTGGYRHRYREVTGTSPKGVRLVQSYSLWRPQCHGSSHHTAPLWRPQCQLLWQPQCYCVTAAPHSVEWGHTVWTV